MKLNLPDFDIKVRRNSLGKIQVYDIIRQKYVALTPEEWVRQHFVNFLIHFKGYPPYKIANEMGIVLNATHKRCDTVVFDDYLMPLAIVEYKAPTINLTPTVFDQIVRYNMVLDVEWLIVSNGINHFCCKMDLETKNYKFLKSIPSYEELSS